MTLKFEDRTYNFEAPFVLNVECTTGNEKKVISNKVLQAIRQTYITSSCLEYCAADHRIPLYVVESLKRGDMNYYSVLAVMGPTQIR